MSAPWNFYQTAAVLCMELMDASAGDILEYLKGKNRRVDRRIVWRIAYAVLKVLEYLKNNQAGGFNP